MQSGDIAIGSYHWWALHSTNNSKIKKDLLIKVSLENVFNDAAVRKIINEWDNLETINDMNNFLNCYTTKEPKINTIYGLVNDMGFFEYKIYYQDYGWYDVIFPNIAQNDYSIIYAQVPVYGMINYRANIMKKIWIDQSGDVR